MNFAIPLTRERPALRTESAVRMSWPERTLLGIGIFEIPLQFDKYFMYHQPDSAMGAVAGINVSITTLCLIGLYALWLGDAGRLRSPALRPHVFGVPMLAYLTCVFVSIAAAQMPLLAVFDLLLLVQAYALFFYLANRIQCRDDLIYCLLVLAATVAVQSLIIFALAVAYRSVAEGTAFSLGPMVFTVWYGGRAAGTMHSAVLAGSTLAMLWLPLTSLLILPVSASVRRAALAAIAAGLLAILMTKTRGAILTTAVGGAVIGGGAAIRRWLPKHTAPLLLALSLLSAIPLMKVIRERVQGDDHGSAAARKHLTMIGLEVIADNPLLGVGAGNCHLAGLPYADQGRFRSEWYYTIHCKYLLVWIETGIVGLLAFLWVLSSGLRCGLGAWRQRDRRWAPIGLALAAAIAGHMLHMLVDVFNSRTQVQILWVLLGLAWAVHRLSTSPNRDNSARPAIATANTNRRRQATHA